MPTAKFITFEGIDGSGKSTVIEKAKDFLQQQGIEVEVSREPGGTILAEKIRDTILSDEFAEITKETEALMMFAARFEHLHKKIIPALKEGKWVLCDRFTDSTFAYQGYGKGLNQEFIERLSELIPQANQPDITLLLDIEQDVAQQRLAQRSEGHNRFDSNAFDFQQKIRSGYLELAKKHPQRIKKINANQDIEQVVNDTIAELQQLLASS